MSRVTALLPLVMQTLVEGLLGIPTGFQSEPLLQLALPATFQVDTVPLSAHWPSAAGIEKQAATSRATSAPAQRVAYPPGFFSGAKTVIDDITHLLLRVLPLQPWPPWASLTLKTPTAS